MLTFVILLSFCFLSVLILVLPLQWAAEAVGAKRQGFWACLTALCCASIAQSFGWMASEYYGWAFSFLISAVTFALILGAGLWKGIGITLLYTLFSVLLLFSLTALLGMSIDSVLMP